MDARTILTARLRLTPPRDEDAEAIFSRYANALEVTRYLSWPRHRSIDDTRAFLAFSAEQWHRWPAGPLLIWERSTGRLLGSSGLAFEESSTALTGYVLATDAWGQGFASESLAAMVDLTRSVGVPRLAALCHPQHSASQRVLEKGGFVRDRAETPAIEFPNLAPGVIQPAYIYARSVTSR